MLIKSENWKYFKNVVQWGARRSYWELLSATVVLPIVEGILINLWTGATAAEAYMPGLCLIVVGLLHLGLAILILVGDQTYPAGRVIDALETEQALADTRREVERRREAYRMIRGAVESLNQQSCAVVDKEWCTSGYYNELMPVMRNFTENIALTLGVTSNSYTIEVHLLPNYLERCNDEYQPHNNLLMPFFFSPQHIDPAITRQLGSNSPARLGLTKGVPGVHRITADPQLFLANGHVRPEVYFRSYATAPINELCSDTHMGVIVLTSMQEGPFAEDVVDSLTFLAALVASYTQAYNSCVSQHKWKQMRKEEEAAESAKAEQLHNDNMGLQANNNEHPEDKPN